MKHLGRFQYADVAFPVGILTFTGTKNFSTVNRSSTSFPQAPISGIGSSGRIQKIKIESNLSTGSAPAYGGTMVFQLYKNNLLAWSSPILGAGGWPASFIPPTSTFNQGVGWYDVNIPYVQTDEFSCRLQCSSIQFNPLGQLLQIWGTTT